VNILLILEDALRPDHLGCYGYPLPTSPTVDRLAREGVVFHNAFATASHTLPPIVSLIMGQWAATHGVVSPKRFEQWIASPRWRDRETPLKVLAARGWRIDGEMVSRWKPLGFSRDTAGEEIGEYFARNSADQWFFMAEPYPTHLPYNPPEEYYRLFLDKSCRPTSSSEERLRVVRSCLIAHPSGVISKLEAGEREALPDDKASASHRRTAGTVDLLPEDRPAIHALYDGEVRVFDDMVAGWVRTLEQLGILDETLIIITADHGEELMERGYVGHCSCNLKGTLFDESIRVPMILRYPRGLPAGTVVRQQVSQVDLMPTIFDLLGLPVPGAMEGSSTLSVIRGASTAFRREAYAETTPAGWQALQNDDREIYCVRTEDWKLILSTDARRSASRWELYDLRADPGERRDVFRPDHPAARELTQTLQAYVRKSEQARF
jgi:arylsulfatase A-like enzyme